MPPAVREARFRLDENLPPRAAELLSEFGLPVLGVGGPWPLPRGTPDLVIAQWCAEKEVVWVTVDRDPRKDREIAAAVAAHGTSYLILPGKGMRQRDYLLMLVRGMVAQAWPGKVAAMAPPARLRARRQGGLARI